jgi:hypothetical protein
MTRYLTMFGAALLCAGLAACGGPDLGTPESCAKSYETARLERKNLEADDRLAALKWECDCIEESLPWYADKSEMEKRLKKQRALYDFVKSNLSDLKKYELEVVGVSEQKEGDKVTGKIVELRIKRKDVSPKGDSGNEFEIKDKDSKSSIYCTQIEGKWKIKRG